MKNNKILFAVIFLFTCGTLVTNSVLGETTLSFASQDPATSWLHNHAIVPWTKQVEEATNGEVKIRIYPSQTLVKGKDSWNSVASGVADMAWCFHGYWPGMTPLSDVMSLPALPFKTAEKGSEIFWRIYEKFPEIQKEFSTNKVILVFTSNPHVLITTEKPIKTIEDFKGMRFRATGGPPTETIKLTGATPVMIPMPDCYISLQKHVVDGMHGPWTAIQAFRLYEVAPYYTEAPFPAVYFTVVMNHKKWDRFPKQIQDQILSTGGLNGSKFWGKNFFDTAKQKVFENAKASGHDIYLTTLSDSERKEWMEVVGKPVWNQWLKSVKSKDYTNGQEVLDSIMAIAE